MKRVILSVIGAVALMSQVSNAAEEEFSLRIRNVPWDFETCHLKAKEFGEKVKSSVKLNVSSTLCSKEEFSGGVVLIVNYKAESEVNFVTTSRDFSVAGSDGYYKTVEECNADLSDQVERFSTNTKLSPLISFCFRPGQYARKFDFFIASIGPAEVVPFNDGYYMYGAPQGYSAKTFTEAFTGLLKKLGGDLAAVSFRNQLANTSASYRYYAEGEINLQEETAARTYDKEVCAAQQARLERALVAAKVDAPNLLYCSHTFGAGTSYELALLVPRDHSFRLFDTSGSTEFDSIEACTAGRAAVIKRFRESFGRTVLEGFCNYDYRSRKYNVKMIDYTGEL